MGMNLTLPRPFPRFLAIDPKASRWSDWANAHVVYANSAEFAAILAAQFMDSQEPYSLGSRSLHIKWPSGAVVSFRVDVEMRPIYSAELTEILERGVPSPGDLNLNLD